MNDQNNLQTILRVIENETGVSEIEMASKSRKQHIVWARYVFANLVEQYLYWTERQITSFLQKNRTMIFHYHFKHKQFMENDKDYIELYSRVLSLVSSALIASPPVAPLSRKEQKNVRLLNRAMLIGVEC